MVRTEGDIARNRQTYDSEVWHVSRQQVEVTIIDD